MPVPAFTTRPAREPDRRLYRRSYVDPLGQPMVGTVTITSLKRIDDRNAVLPAESTAVSELVDGWLEVHLQPGFYKLVAVLTSTSGHRLTDNDTVTITA